MGKELGLTGKDLFTFAQDRDKAARNERRRQREHQKELELEVKKAAEEAKAKPSLGNDVYSILKKSPVPSFDDKVDDIECYFKRFERYAEAMQYPKDKMVALLSTVLTGKALNVYSRLSEALLKPYVLNANGFCRKFRNSKLDSDETYSQFIGKLSGYLKRWIDLSGVEKLTVNSLNLL
ncbi:hypothetical protein HOLleu_00598 [Holothuria leucospilota]|uniref:SCAN box domain-containing protein n=1 Tax=Holothuria leucospilota TaxID=206669 RepID=A0A9Q1HIS8_HOLLE|nr:hypothetical protein HOLleu_00598 [Holothuria leucospilota]